MPLYDPVISARYTKPLLALLHAVPREQLQAILAAAGLDRKTVERSDKVITFAQFDTLLATAIAQTGRSDLGFDLGKKIKLEDHQTLGTVLRHCETIDALLRVLARFSCLVSPSFSYHYRRLATHGELLWRPTAYMSTATLQALEELFAVSVHVELRAMLGANHAPFDVYLSMQRPPHYRRYDELLPTRFHFGTQSMPEIKFVFGVELLDMRLQTAAHETDELLKNTLVAQQRKLRTTNRWSEWVMMILREAEGCQPTREELAGLLNVSRATLNRRLAAEGNTLRELANAIRYQRACELLKDRSQSISQIAYRLGYTDLANFSHAFRAAGGVSPSAYRDSKSGINLARNVNQRHSK